MTDTLTPAERSERMSRIRGKDTTPELIVRKLAHEMGYRFRLHRRDLPGSPDLVFPRYKKVIWVHGCFWHRHEGCRKTTMPATNIPFWEEKFAATQKRDDQNFHRIRDQGWEALIIWECQTKDVENLTKQLQVFLEKDAHSP